MKKILIINPFGIGDVLFTTPVISNLKSVYPDAFIGYWCNERVQGVLKNNPKIDKIFALSRGDIKKIYKVSKIKGVIQALRLFLDLKKRRFDIVFDYSLDHRYGLVCMLAGIKKRLGFDYKGRGRFLTQKKELYGYMDKHVVDYYLDLLRLINIDPKRTGLELYPTKENKLKIKRLFLESGIKETDLVIGISAGGGASWGVDADLKRWPLESYGALADRIIDVFGAKVIFLGDESDRNISQLIIKSMNNHPIDSTGKTTLGELIALIDNLKILITNDGGPLHIGAALGKKTVSFFGPTSPYVYGPYPEDKKHIVLEKKIKCLPCYRNFRLEPCRKNKECLELIDADEAFRAVSGLVAN